MKCVWDCHRLLLRGFYNYGYFLAKHPIWFLVIPAVVCAGLAVGFIRYDPENDIETLYAPEDSRAVKDRDLVVATFPDLSGDNFDPFSANRLVAQGIVIFRSKGPRAVLTDPVLEELKTFYREAMSLTITKSGKNYTYNDLCVRREGACAVDGDFVFSPYFISMLQMGTVTYPVWATMAALDLNLYLSDVNVTADGFLRSAGSIKFAFPLRQDNPEVEKLSLDWELKFADFMKRANFSTVEYSYAISQSLSLELDKGTSGDILYFSLTFTLMITYASIVSSGGDCVSTRALLANAGVLAALLGIMGAFGLITLVGVKFVNIVGVMPFLTLGIGVDDMFLLMGTWSETTALKDISVEERIGHVFKKAGIGITITSVTDFLAFAVGSMSVFRSVKNFCIYTGVGVLLCYICNATFFGACLTFHGRRVYASRHTITCKPVPKSRAELSREGHKCCYVCMCGGTVPKGPNDDQSLCEKGPKYALTKFILWKPMRFVILLIFAGYLGVSVWGCTQLRQGLDLKDLVLTSSYFHKYQIWDTKDFGVKLPISFVTTTTKDYRSETTLKDIQDLFTKAQEDSTIDPLIDSCWLLNLAKTPYYNTTSDDAFFSGLRDFLSNNPRFYNDIVFGPDNMTITASRCQVYSYKVTDSNDQANLMTRMREVADDSPADVFAYHPAFVYFEQYVSVLPSTLQTVGVTLAVMFLVTCIFLPHPLIVVIVMVQVVMIVTGIFGFMALWGLTLSSVTMIHLIMSVGFSVDFCAHVCTAYIVSEERTREDRSRDAIVHASGPIFNGGISSIIGVVVLLFTESYIFQSFFKIMLLVIGFGVLHAVFLIPVILSFIGPATHVDLEDDSPSQYSPSKHNGHSQVEPVRAISNGKVEQSNGGSHAGVTNGGSHAAVTNGSSTHVNKAFENDASLGYLPADTPPTPISNL
ncbi:patched domain-containing protein 3-like [Physella acuta]|uniref:patched domain-containing protein 3-like n=1 Tax=Physella acuta TaxID=109671 RepID=UPI0027DB6324|nr:patched domain-containing protein 3-like [Physella acuta]XP_059176700.1 patched domain-containing protein 3-like [Physella acuta]